MYRIPSDTLEKFSGKELRELRTAGPKLEGASEDEPLQEGAPTRASVEQMAGGVAPGAVQGVRQPEATAFQPLSESNYGLFVVTTRVTEDRQPPKHAVSTQAGRNLPSHKL